ncbi:hypothetical protein AX15_000206 [Amanita polypyramis BW_CC]|nr:hypothetical protein AX15_000206 [Amanita polypyramis BW_CC]
MSSDINYAELAGYHSLAAAIVFAILYTPVAVCYLRFLFLRLERSIVAIVLFCQIRVAAFIIRAVLIGSVSASHILGLYIADQILLSVGFFGLLLAAYELVNERITFVERNYLGSNGRGRMFSLPIALLRNRGLFRAVLTVALVLGIVGISQATSGSASSMRVGATLRKASAIIFLVLTVLQALNTVMLLQLELSDHNVKFSVHTQFGVKNGAPIFLLISILLLVREAYTVATINNVKEQQDERLWYPLVALPELLAVVLYLIPGVITPKETYSQ